MKDLVASLNGWFRVNYPFLPPDIGGNFTYRRDISEALVQGRQGGSDKGERDLFLFQTQGIGVAVIPEIVIELGLRGSEAEEIPICRGATVGT